MDSVINWLMGAMPPRIFELELPLHSVDYWKTNRGK